jgi:hypothetical protein
MRYVRLAGAVSSSKTAPWRSHFPADLLPQQVEAAFRELGVDAEAVLELGGWRTAGCGVAVAHVPFPGAN